MIKNKDYKKIIQNAGKEDKLRFPSLWIGEILMGVESPTLVFNISKNNLGKSIANLSIPSKGLEEIPFDSVKITNDSILLKITAAQASFTGNFESDAMIINGIWKEGNNSFLLILRPLTEEIDYSNFKRENKSSLELSFSSENFKFYSQKQDIKILKKLSEILEDNFLRISKNIHTHFHSNIDVFIYPNLEAFHLAINYPKAPDWVVGAAGKNEIKMVSPLNPGSVHNYESLMKAIVHELAHVILLNLRKHGLVGLPNWLNEGFAYYEAGQLTDKEIKNIHSNLLKNNLPSLQELTYADTVSFGELGGYGISASIIDFLVEIYGFAKLKEFIIEPKNIQNIYKMSEKDLEISWLNYLKQHQLLNEKPEI